MTSLYDLMTLAPPAHSSFIGSVVLAVVDRGELSGDETGDFTALAARLRTHGVAFRRILAVSPDGFNIPAVGMTLPDWSSWLSTSWGKCLGPVIGDEGVAAIGPGPPRPPPPDRQPLGGPLGSP